MAIFNSYVKLPEGTCSWASRLQVVFPLVSLMKDGADGEVDGRRDYT